MEPVWIFYLEAVFMVLEAGIVVYKSVQFLKTFVSGFSLLYTNTSR